MRAHYFDTPNRMHVDSLLKAFNMQTTALGTGNVMGGTQFSNYIRPYNRTECNYQTFVPGALRNFDLKHFDHLPRHVRTYVESVTQNESVILYEFRHYRGPRYDREKIVDGYVVTRANTHELLRKFYMRNGSRAESVVDEAASYVSGRVYEVGETVAVSFFIFEDGETVKKATLARVASVDREAGQYIIVTDQPFKGKTEHTFAMDYVYDADQLPVLQLRGGMKPKAAA